MTIIRVLQGGLLATIAALFQTANAVPIVGQGTWETTLQARDIDRDGIVDAYYDTSLNVTWSARAFSDGPPPGFPPGRPLLSPNDALAYMVSIGWRLPRVHNIIGGSGQGVGYCAPGFNPRLCGTNVDPTLSELPHMYYVTLGNAALVQTDPNQAPTGGLINTGPFSDLRPTVYWTHDYAEPTDFVWAFFMGTGAQFPVEAVTGRGGAAWAVRDGDIAPVPETSTVVLMATGLLLVGATVRRAKRLGNF